MEWCSSLTIIREKQIKTTMRYHLTQVRMAIIKMSTDNKMLERVWRKEKPPSVGGNVNWCSHYGDSSVWNLQTIWRFISMEPPNNMEIHQNTKRELPYDPAIPLLGTYSRKTIISKGTCTLMLIAALFTIAKTWKWPKRPLTDEWIWTWYHIHTTEYCCCCCWVTSVLSDSMTP